MQATVNNVYGILQEGGLSLQDFIDRQKESGRWGSTLDMVFASLMMNVDIVSISNMLKKFETFSTVDFFTQWRTEDYFDPNVQTVYMYHHAFGTQFCSILNPNHFSTLMPIEEERIDYDIECYERHESSLVSSACYLESPINKKAKPCMKQTTIHITEVGVIEDNKSKKEKRGFTSSSIKTGREKAKTQKQCILSTRIIADTEEERLKLIRMKEKKSKRDEFEKGNRGEIWSFVSSNSMYEIHCMQRVLTKNICFPSS